MRDFALRVVSLMMNLIDNCGAVRARSGGAGRIFQSSHGPFHNFNVVALASDVAAACRLRFILAINCEVADFAF